jgi:hypothetical protein
MHLDSTFSTSYVQTGELPLTTQGMRTPVLVVGLYGNSMMQSAEALLLFFFARLYLRLFAVQ